MLGGKAGSHATEMSSGQQRTGEAFYSQVVLTLKFSWARKRWPLHLMAKRPQSCFTYTVGVSLARYPLTCWAPEALTTHQWAKITRILKSEGILQVGDLRACVHREETVQTRAQANSDLGAWTPWKVAIPAQPCHWVTLPMQESGARFVQANEFST